MPPVRSYAFVFVCQAGALENSALLLAASLKRHLRCPHELIAAVPQPAERWGTLAPDTAAMLQQLGVRSEPITNEIDPDYPIGNKISCMRVPAEGADRLVFLDSDILLTRPFDGDPRFDFPFAAKPVDLANIVDPRQWRRAYAAMRLKPPEQRVASTVYGRLVYPCFNAGLVAADPKCGLGDAWLEACRRIDAKWGIRLKRPHLDQIALPVAVHKLGLPYACLDEDYNFPAHLKPIDPARPPAFAHYHSPHVLRREPLLVELARELCDEYPTLADRLRADPEYAPILSRAVPSGVAKEPRPSGSGSSIDEPRSLTLAASSSRAPSFPSTSIPEVIITGFPRSGTSYVCNLLHRFDNCVVLNEPDGISRPLRKEPIPFGVGAFYRDQRREILEGRPIKNKLKDGKVTDETMEANEQTEYVPQVASADFVLGAKSPLGFLSRLPALRRAMPHARIVVCVRNPVDVLASWKTTFSHLLTADVRKMTHGGLRDPFLPDRQRAMLGDVATIRSPAWRRAAWWRYLAELILEAAAGNADLIVVPYVQAVTDPMTVVTRILADYPAGTLLEPIAPSTVRAAKRSALDSEDYQAIRALCIDPATALGVAEGLTET
jgi:Sulfotransferase family